VYHRANVIKYLSHFYFCYSSSGSEYITETILSMLECEVDDAISLKLKKKLGLEKDGMEVTSS
jgi:hypothetical protein